MMDAECIITKKGGIAVKVEPISNGNLRIWLSDDELSAAQSGEEAAVFGLLRQLLHSVQTRLNRLGKHIVAEQIPIDGGCVLLLSARKNTVSSAPLVYRIRNSSDLFCLAEQWPESAVRPHTSLYQTDDGYALAVYPATRLTRRQRGILCEYGRRIGRGEATLAHIAEHGRLLAAGDAFEKLTACEPHPPTPLDRES